MVHHPSDESESRKHVPDRPTRGDFIYETLVSDLGGVPLRVLQVVEETQKGEWLVIVRSGAYRTIRYDVRHSCWIVTRPVASPLHEETR